MELDNVFSTIIGRRLNAKFMNAGVGAYHTVRELVVLKRYVLQKKPKIVVLQFFDNDPQENGLMLSKKLLDGAKMHINLMTQSKPKLSVKEILSLQQLKEMLRKKIFYPTLYSQGQVYDIKGAKIHTYYEKHSYGYIFMDEDAATVYSADNQKMDLNAYITGKFSVRVNNKLIPVIDTKRYFLLWFYTKYKLLEFFKLCDENKIKVILLYVPVPYHAYRDRLISSYDPRLPQFQKSNVGNGDQILPTLLEKLCKQHGVDFINMLDYFRKENDFYFLRYDHHLNKKGHEYIANVVLDLIHSKGYDKLVSDE